MVEVKYESDVNKVIEELADCGNLDTTTLWETLDMEPKELRVKLTDEESGGVENTQKKWHWQKKEKKKKHTLH